jgi:integrase/recombinase XerD
MKSKRLTLVAAKPSNALETLVADYLAHQRGRGLSPRTAALTANILERTFLPWSAESGINAPDQLSQRALDRFSADLLDRKLARESVRTYTRTVGTFIRWAQADDAIAAKLKLHQPEAEHKLVETLTREEITKLEDAAKTERDKLIIRLLADTGIRLGELLGLRAADLIEQGRERYIKVRGKGARERLVPLAPALFQRLRRYAGRDNERVFVTNRKSPKTHNFEPLAPRSVQNMIGFTAEAAKIKRNIHPHLFRHSYATWALRKGMNPLQLQRILGDADLTMISTVYSHLTPSDSYTAMLELLRADD